jgi:hypothetical protein
MLIKIEEGKHRKNGADIIAKILAGDELTQAEQIDYIEMQEKRAQREVKKAVMQDIKAKLDAGEELTVEEQAALDEAKAHRPEGKRGGKGHRGGDRGER